MPTRIETLLAAIGGPLRPRTQMTTDGTRAKSQEPRQEELSS